MVELHDAVILRQISSLIGLVLVMESKAMSNWGAIWAM